MKHVLERMIFNIIFGGSKISKNSYFFEKDFVLAKI